ncbi:protein of unknown function (DUF4586), putative [Trypanosoma equiperdum]|uniref:Cilia-and flagella-associated protein 96 n=2 Tax=Trypanozoon TaxID=39700 RepID=Q382W0_TRYB2|nr:hypothetical protein, conserved [Trypanosoma brucei brucei TREU927]EAN80171.1 hypothetical protein, conserved [Trypanosoma brucei brucei TREU927]SCU65398.1 Domain of unknown function (DUF4586), putative [Trypanosoma equiperdum]
MFSEPVYLTIGDEYEKRAVKPSKSRGRNFIVPVKRSPHITDAVFQKSFISLAVGDEYLPPPPGGTFRQPAEKKPGEPQPLPFKPPSRPHKSCGSGSYYGTFNEKNPPKHEPETTIAEVKKSGANAPAGTVRKPNLYTNPGKKGTYGYTGLTLGRAGEVQYISDPVGCCSGQRTHSPRTQAPFSAAVKCGGCFDEGPHGFSTVYGMNKPLPMRKVPPQRVLPPMKPWRPAGALVREITRHPEYQEDPYDLKEKRLREERLKEQSHKPWFPCGTDAYRHIYTYPVPYNPPPVV